MSLPFLEWSLKDLPIRRRRKRKLTHKELGINMYIILGVSLA